MNVGCRSLSNRDRSCRGKDPMKTILVAPIPITPTKPLSPSHLKGILWVDILLKASSKLADVTCHYSWLIAHASEQTVGFWEFLDRCHGDIEFQDLTEEQIGELYVRYHNEGKRPSIQAISPYVAASERGDWLHPASRRLNEIWSSQFNIFGVQQFLRQSRSPALGIDDVIDRLAAAGLCLDQRSQGGSVYLDVTDEGIPLRQVVTSDGRRNYLISFLRELMPLALKYDHVILVHDEGLDADYFLLQRILSRLGANVCREPITRVPINGVVQSARHGGWQGNTASALIARQQALQIDDICFQLGVRFYLVGILGRSRKLSFCLSELERSLDRARRLLATASSGDNEANVESFLRTCAVGGAYVDPYRVTSSLISRRGHAPIPRGHNGGWYI
jgi:hypothetical protein